MDFKERFEALLSLSKDNKSLLAQQIGVSNKTLGQYFTRGTQPPASLLEKIKRAFPELNSDWLLTGEGEMLQNQENKLDLDKVDKDLAKIMTDLNELNAYLKKYGK